MIDKNLVMTNILSGLLSNPKTEFYESGSGADRHIDATIDGIDIFSIADETMRDMFDCYFNDESKDKI